MFSSLSRKRVVVLLILTSLLLITLDRRGVTAFDTARRGFQKVLQPFDSAADAIAKPFDRAWNGITDYDRLERENEALRDQIDAQKGAVVVAKAVILQDQVLRQLYQIAQDYPHVMGRVVGASPSNFSNTVEISVGRNRNLVAGMPVLSNAGLIGKVTRIYDTTAEVRLITDPGYSIRAEVLAVAEPSPPDAAPTEVTTPSGKTPTEVAAEATTSTSSTTLPEGASTSSPPGSTSPATTTTPTTSTPVTSSTTAGSSTTTTTTIAVDAVRETGTLQGQGNDKPIILRFVDDDNPATSIKVGDVVQTAGGTDDLAPEGLPIGVISKISRQTGSRALIVEVKPSASINRLNFVSVVLYTPGAPAET